MIQFPKNQKSCLADIQTSFMLQCFSKKKRKKKILKPSVELVKLTNAPMCLFVFAHQRFLFSMCFVVLNKVANHRQIS